jgi:kynurenine formamidase
VIQLTDVQRVLENEKLAPPGIGDVVIFYTGWDSVFGVENARFSNSPGPGIEVGNWLASRKVALVGADTQAVEAVDGDSSVEVRANPMPFGAQIGLISNAVHFILLTKHGIHFLEHMNLKPLANDILAERRGSASGRRGGMRPGHASPYEFLFVFAPVPIAGLTGSPGQPLAVR